jgi:uncharacterized protein (TIGR02597 family)
VLLALSLQVVAQTPVPTTPVSLISVTIPGAATAAVPGNRTVSIPLLKPAEFTGRVTSLDNATSFSLANANLPNLTTPPRLVRVKSSSVAGHVGRFFLITGNTAARVTVDLNGTGLSNVNGAIGVGDACEILPANTLGNVFGDASRPPALKAGATANEADNVYLWNGTGWDAFFWTGAVGSPVNIWKLTGTTDRTNTVIFPDDGVFIVRRDATPVNLTLVGTVPTTTEQSAISGAGGTFLGHRFPVDTTLAALGLATIPGWRAGATANTADTVRIWNNASNNWDTYFWTGTVGTPNNIWKRTGATNRGDTPIPAGTAVYIEHSGAAFTLTQPPPYTP